MTDAFECVDCGWRTFYERSRCPECGNESFEPWQPTVGTLLAKTTNYVTPDGVRQPNALGLARFDGDVDVVAQLEDDVEPGDDVRLEDGYELRETDDGALIGARFVAASRRRS